MPPLTQPFPLPPASPPLPPTLTPHPPPPPPSPTPPTHTLTLTPFIPLPPTPLSPKPHSTTDHTHPPTCKILRGTHIRGNTQLGGFHHGLRSFAYLNSKQRRKRQQGSPWPRRCGRRGVGWKVKEGKEAGGVLVDAQHIQNTRKYSKHSKSFENARTPNALNSVSRTQKTFKNTQNTKEIQNTLKMRYVVVPQTEAPPSMPATQPPTPTPYTTPPPHRYQ